MKTKFFANTIRQLVGRRNCSSVTNMRECTFTIKTNGMTYVGVSGTEDEAANLAYEQLKGDGLTPEFHFNSQQ